MKFGTSVEEAVKRVSKWAAALYTPPNSFRKLPASHVVYTVPLPKNFKVNLTGDKQK